MPQTFFISDCHFGHEAVIRRTHRPFSSLEEMEFVLIHNWNARVTDEDTVWILGDMFYHHKNPEIVLEKLKGHKRLILGNHDEGWSRKVDLNKYFDSVNRMAETMVDNHYATLCHYPMMDWKNPYRTWMIHGHIHNHSDMTYWPLIKSSFRMLNASVEVNGYVPVTFDELIENNKVFKAEH